MAASPATTESIATRHIRQARPIHRKGTASRLAATTKTQALFIRAVIVDEALGTTSDRALEGDQPVGVGVSVAGGSKLNSIVRTPSPISIAVMLIESESP